MTKAEFKDIITLYAKSMCDKWFDSNNLNDTLAKALAVTIINANLDKYDNYLDYVTDSRGQVCVNDFIDNIIDNFGTYQLDLTQYDIPFLPNKILLLGKQDLLLLKRMCTETISQDEQCTGVLI